MEPHQINSRLCRLGSLAEIVHVFLGNKRKAKPSPDILPPVALRPYSSTAVYVKRC
jgi:hypothetical protein